jgi:hypothetical protein
MKRLLAFLILAGVIGLAVGGAPARAASWEGVDKTVIEKFAGEAGRPARQPLIDTDQGDLLLLAFLLAGGAGGFAAGYWFRVLFPPRRRDRGSPKPAAGPKGASPPAIGDAGVIEP